MGWIIGAILIVIAFIIAITNIFVVQQSRAYVIERLGGVYSSGKERLMSLIEEYRKSLKRIAKNKEKIKDIINILEMN